ncbi:hypothetical protein MIND_01045100 [Mycena indigotica]|uniref:Uncharacterized protein n=1 Tax=Mycena indigotica TaxID=2126181 RepID=A0A8H6VYM8_9AGAR|nr:uncharacterized protein MIND_01045100 [Mycena indigotica]KAF7295068.1 hypothetical protein MIND_01045100 [Mycena indigotica]
MTSTNLSTLARSKLSRVPSSSDSKDSFSLHRWVLLKNSIIQTLPPPVNALPAQHDEADDELDSFMFPDAGNLMESPAAASEAAWLDSLLETLGEEEDESVDCNDEDLSPISPMEDQCYYPFLVPYPPYSPPPPPLPYVDPLPYFDFDDLPPVPDAIEDTSDDESDAPTTPGQSLSSLDPASIPLPPEHSSLRHSPHIYIDDEDEDYFNPLPFAHNSPHYSEC